MRNRMVDAHRANAVPPDKPKTANINIFLEFTEETTLDENVAQCQKEARAIANALYDTLPGTTLEAVLGILIQKTATFNLRSLANEETRQAQQNEA